MVKEMDENDKKAPEEKKPSAPDKELKLDLSQALTPDSDDDDVIIELKDEIADHPDEEESEINLNEPATVESSDDDSNDDAELNLKAFDIETAAQENDSQQLEDFTFEPGYRYTIRRPYIK